MKDIKIPGVEIRKLSKYEDERGWLCECFREDEISEDIAPVMAYFSVTLPGVVRGPHEHIEQTDYFCFTGSSEFRLYLWDNRKGAQDYRKKTEVTIEEGVPVVVIVPPGVVHAYKNTGDKDGFVINFPNKLFAGYGKKEKVDEIRHENMTDTVFKV